MQNHEKVFFEGAFASVKISISTEDILDSVQTALGIERDFSGYVNICDAQKELEWTLDVLYQCTQIDKAKAIVSRPRTVQSLLSILLGVFDARDIAVPQNNISGFKGISSTSPANKLKAARVLVVLLKNIPPQKILSDKYISNYWTPETVVESLFQLYQHLDCVVMDSDMNSATISCSARYLSMLMFEIEIFFILSHWMSNGLR